MKNSNKLVGIGSVIGAFSFVIGGCLTHSSKEWIDNKINQGITGYEQKDKQWTRKNFEKSLSLEQLANVFNSTYQVLNEPSYKTSDDTIIVVDSETSAGSGVLLRGGYFLTSRHIIEGNSEDYLHEDHGLVTYDHSEFFLRDKVSFETVKKERLEKILMGKDIDYSLFKLKDSQDLQFYNNDLNQPDKINPGMKSIVVGFPLDTGRNIRLGNVSQAMSDPGEEYLTFRNNAVHGDSGGPIFVIEKDNLKLVAITTGSLTREDPNISDLYHPTSIDYGLKISSIISDMKNQLQELDEEAVKEVKNFLKLNL